MMSFNDFERIISPRRLNRYMIACRYNRRKALILYRLNIRLSDEMFGVVCCFEVALRNAIHDYVVKKTGNPHWLRDSIMPGGMFYRLDKENIKTIKKQYDKLSREGAYDPGHMVAGLEFGTWRYMFSTTKYTCIRNILNRFPNTQGDLLDIFPHRPINALGIACDSRYIFNQLKETNDLRNRIAHHEPICFIHGVDVINIQYSETEYKRMNDMLGWMGVNSSDFLKGIENVKAILKQIEQLKKSL